MRLEVWMNDNGSTDLKLYNIPTVLSEYILQVLKNFHLFKYVPPSPGEIEMKSWEYKR